MNLVFDLRHIAHSGIGRFTREIIPPCIQYMHFHQDNICLVFIIKPSDQLLLKPILSLIHKKNYQFKVITTYVSPYSPQNILFGIRYFWNSVVFMPHFTVSIFLLFAKRSIIFIHDAYPYNSQPFKFLIYKLLLNLINIFGNLSTASPSKFASSQVIKLLFRY